ncbi:hypothetical protein PIB30_104631, partial [Stylosanthes scabra]|nr:hypothetical protein [Stylosanthes scabra]
MIRPHGGRQCSVLSRRKGGPLRRKELDGGFKEGGFRRSKFGMAGGGPTRPLRRS